MLVKKSSLNEINKEGTFTLKVSETKGRSKESISKFRQPSQNLGW